MSDMNSLIKGIGNKNRSLASKDEEILNKEEVLANYNFNYDDVDDETIDYLKDVTYKIHSTTHKFYTNLGKMLLETQEKGHGGEIQLTDSILKLMKTESVYAYDIKAKRYDIGYKIGFLEAQIDYALDSSLKEDVLKLLKEKVK